MRIFNTFGPHMRADDSRMIPGFIRQAIAGEPLTVAGDGGQTRSLCDLSEPWTASSGPCERLANRGR